MLNTPCSEASKDTMLISVAEDTENVHARNDQPENSMHTTIISSKT